MLPAMVFIDIPLEEIDAENDAFRISEELDSAQVLDSLREIGQLNPVILLELKPQMAIVCGFRRIRALRQLGICRSLARILSSEDFDKTRAFEMALRDNLSHRELNALEKARVLFKLQNMFEVCRDRLIEVYLPILGLAPNQSVLQSYLTLYGIHPGLKRCLEEGLLTLPSLENLAGMPTSVQESIVSLMSRIRLSASLQKKFLGLLGDLAAMTGNSFDAPLRDPETLGILQDARLSPFQRGEEVHKRLYRLLNPRLSQATDRFTAKSRQLGLPGSIRINVHPFIEEPGLRIEFDASTAENFRRLAAALQDAAQRPELEELFKIE